MSYQQGPVSKRWIIAVVGATLGAFLVGGVLSVIIGSERSTDAGSGTTSLDANPASTPVTTTRSTSTSPPPPPTPEVALACYQGTAYSDRQHFRMDVGGDFAPIWGAAMTSCEATREPGTLTPVEQQAITAAGYPHQESITTLYELCAKVDPSHTYVSPTHTLSAGQIAEVTGMLTLCPGHPQAPQLSDAVKRAQAEASAEAAGELFHAGTFLVNSEVPPGTYAVEGEIANCYWERTDASGEIIDNNFVTGARRVEVTIRASDYSFHSEGCGKWRKVP
jgi:hypothetical protein